MRPTENETLEKRYYRIGEASALTGIEPYVLRYWETEFSKIRPARSRSGQRLYRKVDIEVIRQIKDLLYQKRYTIEGARQHLNKPEKQPVQPAPPADDQSLTIKQLRKELVAIRDLLSK